MSLTRYVSAEWVEQHLDSLEHIVLDPRSPVRYMMGHPRNAVSAPVAKARDAQGLLRPAAELAQWLGAAGVDERRTPVIFDSADGRNGAFLAWILLYLGRSDVHVMETFWEQWTADGREAFYKPVEAVARNFTAKPRPEIRATMEQVQTNGSRKLIDFRSAEEFTGELDTEGRPGHIPGAVHLSWQELSRGKNFLASKEKLAEIFAARGISANGGAIAYCRTGVRAALGYLALAELGIPAALYDGSYAEWAKSGRAVEATFEKREKGESA